MGTVNFARDVNNALDTNYAYSNPMLGTITGYLESDRRLDMHGRYSNLEYFVQDSWRATKRLTLDLGVRFYHINSTISEGSRLASFEPGDFNPWTAAQLIQAYRATPTGPRVGRNPQPGRLCQRSRLGPLLPEAAFLSKA
jgi:outer membrane receptor protein involved in Fe transport